MLNIPIIIIGKAWYETSVNGLALIQVMSYLKPFWGSYELLRSSHGKVVGSTPTLELSDLFFHSFLETELKNGILPL